MALAHRKITTAGILLAVVSLVTIAQAQEAAKLAPLPDKLTLSVFPSTNEARRIAVNIVKLPTGFSWRWWRFWRWWCLGRLVGE
jgi:hypothetical protein